MSQVGQGRLIAGAMSGTSADGVDVALVRVEGQGLAMSAKLLRHHAISLEPDLKRLILRVRGEGGCTFAELTDLGRRLCLAYVACVRAACEAERIDAATLDAVAAHGQTLYHAPPATIQWFDPSLVAHELGCPVVSDFRRADCAAGGQGAPLVPFADYVLFRHPTRTRVLLNLGGIANVTVLPAGGTLDDVLAFDTGPANCVSDWLCRSGQPDGPGYDAGGAMALRGKVVAGVSDAITRDPYVLRPPPKSTDGPAMIAAFERAMTQVSPTSSTLDDLLATACHATAATVRAAMDLHVPGWREQPVQFFVSGGGVDNARLMHELHAALLPDTRATVDRSDDLAMPAAAKEAVAFALLGAATLDGEPSNVPCATGARERVVLGSVTPRPRAVR